MKFTLPKLPYQYNALEPYIDAATMELHHSKHHQTYIDKLNAALAEDPSLESLTIEDLLKKLDTLPSSLQKAVRNHGGGHHNHSLFWESLAPAGQNSLSSASKISQAFESTFGSFDTFKTKFSEAALNQFGSGWAWLVKKPDSRLDIYSLPNQDSPLTQGDTPLLGLDVWEHAYYLKYQNRRADYINAFFEIVNWHTVSSRL